MATKSKKLHVNPFKSSVVKQCSCSNENQDSLYGKKMRLWNHAPCKGAKSRRYRCTVCLKEIEF